LQFKFTNGKIPKLTTGMKKVLILSILAGVFISGCGLFGKKTGKDGNLTGVAKRPSWDSPVPYGMLTVPAGSFHMGQNDQDINYSQIAHNKQITVSAFHMDETEIENNEYRQFVNDMNDQSPDWATDKDKLYENFKYSKNQTTGKEGARDSIIDYITATYDSKYIAMNPSDPIKKEAAQDITAQNFYSFIYPDTLVWRRDFTFAYNEPLTENYWWHPAYDNYPVVGVSWHAAQAFCVWRTILFNNNRAKIKRPALPRFRLPTEAEWEYAARGGFEHKLYPWEGYYIRNSKGCLFANFKPGRGNYIDDNFEYTCPVKSYWPNDYGLYCMTGNVAEWCEDDFEETAYSYAHELNPIYKSFSEPKTSRRVIRGGSWKDIAYFLSVGTRSYEYADTTKSYIGFRCVVSVLGHKGTSNL
jgi:gliding motility-associated lipoprotein GldK